MVSQRFGVIFFEHMGNKEIPVFIREIKTSRTHLGAKRIALQLVRKYRPHELDYPFTKGRRLSLRKTAETYSHQFVDGSGFVIVAND